MNADSILCIPDSIPPIPDSICLEADSKSAKRLANEKKPPEGGIQSYTSRNFAVRSASKRVPT